MPFEFNCPSCYATLRVPDEARGKAVKCPQCESISHGPVEPVEPVKPYGESFDFSSPSEEQPYKAHAYEPDPYEQPDDQQAPSSPSTGSTYGSSAYGNSGSVFGDMDSGYESSSSGSGGSDYSSYGSSEKDTYSSAHSSPYASPQYSSSQPRGSGEERVKKLTMPAAITWLVFGLLHFIFMVLVAIGDLLEGRNSFDVLLLGALAVLALVGVLGAISMINMKSYALCMIGTICSILSGFGCCFIPSFVAIWPLVVLLLPNTARHFD